MSSAIFRCGHPRTPDNTKSSPSNRKGRCRQCLLETVRARSAGRDAIPPEQRAWNEMAITGSEMLLEGYRRYFEGNSA